MFCMNTATRNQSKLLIRGVIRLCHPTALNMYLLYLPRFDLQFFRIQVFDFFEMSYWIGCLQCARSARIHAAEDQEGPINCDCVQTVMKATPETML